MNYILLGTIGRYSHSLPYFVLESYVSKSYYIVFHHITNSDIDSIRYRPVWTKTCLNVRILTMLSFRNNVGLNLKRMQLEALSSVNFC